MCCFGEIIVFYQNKKQTKLNKGKIIAQFHSQGKKQWVYLVTQCHVHVSVKDLIPNDMVLVSDAFKHTKHRLCEKHTIAVP